MNSYFASVEQQDRPELRGHPVAVSPVEAETTCCIAASYEAKKFGIRTGTPIYQARRLCPGIKIVKARPTRYVDVHHQIVAAVDSCLPVLRTESIDEMVCRLQPSDRTPERATALAAQVKQAIYHKVGAHLRCSIGLGPNRFLAKVASDMQKPNGMTAIHSEELPERLYPLKLNDFPGIGPRMERRFHRAGVKEVQQLCQMGVPELARIWGSKLIAGIWWGQLRGEDAPLPPTPRRTVGHSHVLAPEFRCPDRARLILLRLVHKAAARLRHLQHWAGSIAVYVDFTDGRSWEESHRIVPCQDTPTLLRLADQLWSRCPPMTPLRVGTTFSHLAHERNLPRQLFEEDRKLVRLSRVLDQVNRRLKGCELYCAAIHGAQRNTGAAIAFTYIPDVSIAES
jgi:DNA polymerase-4